MVQIPPIGDNYIDEVIRSNGPYNGTLNKTQGIKLRELIKKLRDYFEQEMPKKTSDLENDNHFVANDTLTALLAEINNTIAGIDTSADANAAAIAALLADSNNENNTLAKLYNLIQVGFNEKTFTTVAERDAYMVKSLPFQAFVTDDGDGKWALYRAISIGSGANYVKISDPDLLNMVMSSQAIKAAYESNPDTNAFTTAQKNKLDGIAAGAEVNVNPDWNAVDGKASILNKPALFPPSEHNHTISSVTGLETALNNKFTGSLATDAETQVLTAVTEDNKVVSRLKLFNWWAWVKAQAVELKGFWNFSNGLQSAAGSRKTTISPDQIMVYSDSSGNSTQIAHQTGIRLNQNGAASGRSVTIKSTSVLSDVIVEAPTANGKLALVSGDAITLASGTATTPPLIIPNGVLTTSPQNGAIERDSNGLFYVTVGSQRTILTGGLSGSPIGSLATDAETQITTAVTEDNKVVSRLKLFNWWAWVKAQAVELKGLWNFSNGLQSAAGSRKTTINSDQIMVYSDSSGNSTQIGHQTGIRLNQTGNAGGRSVTIKSTSVLSDVIVEAPTASGKLALVSGDSITLASGTATKPPLIIPNGVLTTMPQNGAIERDNNGILWETNGVRRRITPVVQNNLTTTTTSDVLDAKQGNVLLGYVNLLTSLMEGFRNSTQTRSEYKVLDLTTINSNLAEQNTLHPYLIKTTGVINLIKGTFQSFSALQGTILFNNPSYRNIDPLTVVTTNKLMSDMDFIIQTQQFCNNNILKLKFHIQGWGKILVFRRSNANTGSYGQPFTLISNIDFGDSSSPGLGVLIEKNINTSSSSDGILGFIIVHGTNTFGNSSYKIRLLSFLPDLTNPLTTTITPIVNSVFEQQINDISTITL